MREPTCIHYTSRSTQLHVFESSSSTCIWLVSSSIDTRLTIKAIACNDLLYRHVIYNVIRRNTQTDKRQHRYKGADVKPGRIPVSKFNLKIPK